MDGFGCCGGGVSFLGVSRISKQTLKELENPHCTPNVHLQRSETKSQEFLSTSGPQLDTRVEKIGEYGAFSEKIYGMRKIMSQRQLVIAFSLCY